MEYDQWQWTSGHNHDHRHHHHDGVWSMEVWRPAQCRPASAPQVPAKCHPHHPHHHHHHHHQQCHHQWLINVIIIINNIANKCMGSTSACQVPQSNYHGELGNFLQLFSMLPYYIFMPLSFIGADLIWNTAFKIVAVTCVTATSLNFNTSNLSKYQVHLDAVHICTYADISPTFKIIFGAFRISRGLTVSQLIKFSDIYDQKNIFTIFQFTGKITSNVWLTILFIFFLWVKAKI